MNDSSQNAEYQKRLSETIKELKQYFTGTFADDLAKAVGRLPVGTRSEIDKAADILRDVKATASSMNDTAKLMKETMDVQKQTLASLMGGSGAGGSSGSGSGAGGVGTPGTPSAGRDAQSPETAYYVEITKTSIRGLADDIHQKLTGLKGMGGEAHSPSSPASDKQNVAQGYKEAKQRNDIAELDNWQNLKDKILGREAEGREKAVLNIFQESLAESQKQLIRNMGTVVSMVVSESADVLSGQRALDKIALYFKQGMDANTATFADFGGSLTNDIAGLFRQSEMLSVKTIKMMEALNAKNSMAYAFFEGNAYQFGSEIAKVRTSLDQMREGTDNLYTYLSADDQAVMLGNLFDQMVATGVTADIRSQALKDAAGAQYDILKTIAVSSGKSLEQLILSNEKSIDIETAAARMGLDGKQQAVLDGVFKQFQMINPIDADLFTKMLLDLETAPERAFLNGNEKYLADGRAAMMIELATKAINGQINSENLLDEFSKAAEQIQDGYAFLNQGFAETNIKTRYMAVNQKEGAERELERLTQKTIAWWEGSPIQTVLDVISAGAGLIGITDGMSALTAALWANTAAQGNFIKGFGKTFGPTLAKLFGPDKKGMAAFQATGAMAPTKGMFTPTGGAFMSMAGKIGGVGGLIVGATDIFNAWQGEVSDSFKNSFSHISDETERNTKQLKASVQAGIVTAGIGLLAFVPGGAIPVAIAGALSWMTEIITGKGLVEWITLIANDWNGGWAEFGKKMSELGQSIWGFVTNPFGWFDQTAAAAVVPATATAATAAVGKQMAEINANQSRISSNSNRNGEELRMLQKVVDNTANTADGAWTTATEQAKNRSPTYRSITQG